VSCQYTSVILLTLVPNGDYITFFSNNVLSGKIAFIDMADIKGYLWHSGQFAKQSVTNSISTSHDQIAKQILFVK